METIFPQAFSEPMLQAMYAEIGFAVQHFPRYCHTQAGQTHGHLFLEINYILCGTARQCIGGETRVVTPGSLGIIHYGQTHELITDDDGVEVINLYLDLERHALPTIPESLMPTLCALFPPGPFPGRRQELGVFLDVTPPEHLGGLLRYLWHEQQAGLPGAALVMQDGLRMFLIACARAAMDRRIPTLSAGCGQWQLVETVRQRLDREYAAPHRLDDLAAAVGYTREYLCRQFKAYTGVTVFAYLLERRIQHARRLLRTTDKKVLTIALECGFNDLTHFNRTFRALSGCAPRAFRQARSEH